MTLFEKAAVFTDIHFGKKSDSEQHNQDCLDFVDWFISQVNEHDCDTIIFMGDWYDNRSRLRVDTVNYSWQAIERLVATGLPIYWLMGNHDLFFKTNRNVHSLPYLTQDSITVINSITEIDDVLFCPWLVGNEFTDPPSYEVKYVFGHFELPLFLLNEMVEMPDRGGLHGDHFYQCDAVFSGHFHKRQLKVNENGVPIWYIGNCFPHDFNDVGDNKRGCMILEWGKDPEFVNWEEAPNFHRIKLSKLLGEIENGAYENTYNDRSVVECQDDMGIEIEEATEISNILSEHVRDIRLRPKRDALGVDEGTDIPEDGLSVDQLVIQHLREIDTEGSKYDSELLVQLYQSVGN